MNFGFYKISGSMTLPSISIEKSFPSWCVCVYMWILKGCVASDFSGFSGPWLSHWLYFYVSSHFPSTFPFLFAPSPLETMLFRLSLSIMCVFSTCCGLSGYFKILLPLGWAFLSDGGGGYREIVGLLPTLSFSLSFFFSVFLGLSLLMTKANS